MPNPGIGASGFVGIALEATSGTYLAPTKYVPILSEGLHYVQETNWRRAIRQSADVQGAVPGNSRIEGDLSIEALSDTVPYFLYCARTTPVKTGTAPYTYTFKPNANAIPSRTMSITIVRNGVVFGYTGMIVDNFTFSVDNGQLKMDMALLGQNEATQTLPTPTWGTTTPFGAGQWNVQIPTATQVFDADKFEFKVDDAASAEYRLKNTGTGAQFARYGERTVTLSTERDFLDRTDYDNYKALTSQQVQIAATKGAGESITFAVPVAFKDSYDINGLSGQGDLIRAAITYQCIVDATGNAYTITIVTPTENIT